MRNCTWLDYPFAFYLTTANKKLMPMLRGDTWHCVTVCCVPEAEVANNDLC